MVKLGLFPSFGKMLDNFAVTLPVGFVGYFVLGYLLDRKDFTYDKKKVVFVSLIVSALSVILIAVGTHFSSIKSGRTSELFYGYHSPLVVLYSVCMFVVTKLLFKESGYWNSLRISSFIQLMSKYSLSIYMLHVPVLILIQKFGIKPSVHYPIITTLTIAIGIYLVSFLTIHICSKSVVFRRYMM